MCRRARRRRRRQLAGGYGELLGGRRRGAPPAASALRGPAGCGVLAEPLVDPRAAHPGDPDEVGHRHAVVRGVLERPPQQGLATAARGSRASLRWLWSTSDGWACDGW